MERPGSILDKAHNTYRSESAATQMTSCLGSPSTDLTTDKMAHRKCHRPNANAAPRAHVLLNKCMLAQFPRTAMQESSVIVMIMCSLVNLYVYSVLGEKL